MNTVFVWFAASALAAIPGEDAGWKVIRDGDVRVECADVKGTPWCRSTGVVAAKLDKVDETLTIPRTR